MNTTTISTRYSTSIRVKGKTFVVFLRTPSEIHVFGPGIELNNPLKLQISNTENETEWDYTEDFIWDNIKYYKKNLRKSK